MKTADGRSRRFGFVGYKTPEDAADAVRYFNQTFVDMSRVDVELARSFADPTLSDESWRQRNLKKKRSLEEDTGKEAHQASNDVDPSRLKRIREMTMENEDKADNDLSKFVSVMASQGPTRSYLNEDIVLDDKGRLVTDNEEKNKESDSAAQNEDQQRVQVAEVVSVDETATDEDWLKMRRKRIVDGVPEESSNGEGKAGHGKESEQANKDTVEAEKVTEDTLSPREKDLQTIQRNGRLFVRNLSYECTEDDLEKFFVQCGALEEVHMPVDRETGKNKGFGYILFEDAENAIKAYENLDKQILQGRLIHILPSMPKREKKLDEFELKKLPLRQQKEYQRRIDSAKGQFTWNSLYMNQDAVVASLANTMGVSKAELLDIESTDAAVRQALAETHVINDAKTYFTQQGVDIDAFKYSKKKSETAILVKNFPFDTSVEELRALFGRSGQLSRCLMPPSGTIAIIEFVHASEARAAFGRLAYSRFKNSVLYLEKAPKDIFKNAPADEERQVKELAVSKKSILEETGEDKEEENFTGPTTSLFVKNLNFKTTSAGLSAAFRPLSEFTHAIVRTKPDPKDATKSQSMGFGFVEFRSKEAANVALKAMSDFILDGHKLELKLSHRGQDSGYEGGRVESTAKTSGSSSKIIIKNLPFEATKRDVRKLFGTFGQLKHVRVPKKFDQSARGFAFAEFTSRKEAETAVKSLRGTHLLGRRLVLEYAAGDAISAEQEIERMQRKVRSQVVSEQAAAMRLTGKRKIDLEGDDEDVM